MTRHDSAARGKTSEIVYCILPPDLAASLHEPLRAHFRDDPRVEVIVERRRGNRRGTGERRAGDSPNEATEERRVIRNPTGRRVGERRAGLVPVAGRGLPRGLRRHARRLQFVERVEPSGDYAEDLDTARLVTHIQAGNREAFGDLYMRYFDRVYGYLRLLLDDHHEAEDATQQVFMKVLEALPRYERRSQPFRAWLFVVVRNHALTRMGRLGRTEVSDPEEVARRVEDGQDAEPDPGILNWISDRELLLFVERLAPTQRQVLVMRYMLDMSGKEIAEVMGTSHVAVRSLQYRALGILAERLRAAGRAPKGRTRAPIRRGIRQAPVLRWRRFALR